MNTLRRAVTWFFGPRSQFHIGDAVQLPADKDRFMVVTGIELNLGQEARIVCHWEEPGNGCKKGIFNESELQHFDWDGAYRRVG